ncbi:MAG: hypothetical protein IIZ27_02025 [Solobacterium sp.]|nr:hypothetical protein [Solobacterium sp.]
MKRIWNQWLKEAVFIYCVVYTFATLLNSILYLAAGVRNDPSGNWHEITRAVIVLIGIAAYELARHLPVKNLFLRAVAVYIPTMLLAFAAVWLTQFIEPLAKSAYMDIFINYTAMFLLVSVIAVVTARIRNKSSRA